MKPKFRARELWLFAPFVLIGAAALFYWRWERVNPPDKRGMYVARIERTPATGREESGGISHHVTVTLSHGWPRPLWWGERTDEPYLLDPLQPTKPATLYYGAQSDKSFASGGLATGIRGGKEVVFESQYTASPGVISFDGTNYRVEHSLPLRGAYQGAGEVIFKGLYRFKNSKLVEAQKIVRASGELFPPIDKNSGLRVVATKFSPWKKEQIIDENNVLVTTDEIFISVVVEPTLPLVSEAEKHELNGTSTNAKDEGATDFAYTTYEGKEPSPKIALKPGQISKTFHLAIDEKDATKGRITIEGELWMDGRWSLPFKVKLPPRPKAAKK